MGQHDVNRFTDPEQLRIFTQCVLRDLRALEHMIAEGLIETGVRRIGIEQEMFLVDRAWRPAPRSTEILAELDDHRFTTELALFNLEANLPPLELRGDCLRRMEETVQDAVEAARVVAARHKTEVILTGILPTLRHTDLDIENMAPIPRYFALNEAIKRLRGAEFELRVIGPDEVNIKHDSVMLEACNTSCQVHIQVEPNEFARLYNITQVAAAPVLAVSCNSPLLFGRRLWRETRIAVFEQAVDTRAPAHHVQERSARVSFGRRWVRESALEIYEEDIARFRTIVGIDVEEDPFAVLAEGRIPKLQALALHNGTVYRWNRPCYGVYDGKAHLRIENRILPSGPTVLDEVANAAFWFGLVSGLSNDLGDVTAHMAFQTAKANFVAAARGGLDAQLTWFGDRRVTVRDLVRRELLPLARGGLERLDLDRADIERYLGIIEHRVETGNTGAEWITRSMSSMKEEGTLFERLRAIVAAMATREQQGQPVHAWTPARVNEAGGWKHNYQRVGQYMTTDVFTVHEDEVIDLIANVMAWRNIRHVPIENDEHRVVGLVSYRTLLNFIARELPHGRHEPVPVSRIMQRDPVTISPEAHTLDAIQTMRDAGVACLPVVKNDQLVGIITEHDFMNIAAHLLREGIDEE